MVDYMQDSSVGINVLSQPDLLVCAEMWVLWFREFVNHVDDNTTAHCEGYHNAIKALLRAAGIEALRVDKLIYFLLTTVLKKYIRTEAKKDNGVLSKQTVAVGS